MKDAQYTLANVFSIEPEQLTPERCREMAEDVGIGVLTRGESGGHRYHRQAALLHMILDKTNTILDVPVSTILVRGWVRWQKLQDQFQQAMFRRDESMLVPLCEHVLKSIHEPHIDVYRGNDLIHTIRIKIELAIEVRGAALSIENARITEIQTGDCRVTGSIELDGCKIAKEQSRRLELPGRIHFEPGIELARFTTEPVVIAPDVEAMVAQG